MPCNIRYLPKRINNIFYDTGSDNLYVVELDVMHLKFIE